MADIGFEALIAELAPVRKRHTVYVGTRSIIYYETAEEAEAEVSRLKSCGHADASFRTTNYL